MKKGIVKSIKKIILFSLFFIISSAASLKLRQKTHLKTEVTEKSQEVMEKKSGLVSKLRKKSRQVMAKK